MSEPRRNAEEREPVRAPRGDDSVTRKLDEIEIRERYEPNPPGRELARRVVSRAKRK